MVYVYVDAISAIPLLIDALIGIRAFLLLVIILLAALIFDSFQHFLADSMHTFFLIDGLWSVNAPASSL